MVKVVIPIYKDFFGHLEEKSFRQCCKVLGNHEIVIIHPEGLNIDYLTEIHKSCQSKIFFPHYFASIEGYNELLLSSFFYENFLDSEYILIYQLDAFVFKDELEEWCSKGYDYIGSPWLASSSFEVTNRIFQKFTSKKNKIRQKIFFKVGNGGFSLRKTASHFAISKQYETFIANVLKEKHKKLYAIEDVFWSLKAPEFDKNFKIPDYKEAVFFGLDRKPKLGFKLTNNKLPFGCHGINKPKVIRFWKPILDEF
ncbi:MAG: DUF5672 family protein [Flavobacterium sp.]